MTTDTPFLIRPDERLVLDDVRWRVVDRLDDGLTLFSDNGEKRPFRWSYLRQLLREDRAYIIKLSSRKKGRAFEARPVSLDGYRPEYVEVARHRRKYCRAVDLALRLRAPLRRLKRDETTELPFRFTKTEQSFEVLAKRVARAVEQTEGDQYLPPNARFMAREELAPCGSTLSDWFTNWTEGGRTIEALIPNHEGKGKTGPRSHDIVRNVMEEFADRYWLQPERNDVPNVFRLVRNEIRNRCEAAGMDSLESESIIPSERTFRRLVDDIGAYDIYKYRLDPREADRKFKLKRKGPTYERPFEAIQIDHTGLPMVMRDPDDKLVLKGVTCTFAIDLFSRAPVGWYAGLEPPGWAPVQQCLKMAMTSKSWLRRLENIKSTELVKDLYGTPFTIFSDRGAEFRGGSLADACGQLNMRHLAPPPGMPHYRGVIERMFRRLKKSIFAGMPGRLFKDGRRKIEYDAAGNAILDADQINWVLSKFFFDMFSIDWHDGIKSSPVARFQSGAKKWGVRIPPDTNALVPLLATVLGTRTIQHTGVEVFGLFYGADSRELQELLNKYGPGGKQFTIKMDAFDVGRVYLLDPTSKHFIALNCTDESWRGRTLHSLKVSNYRAARKKDAHQRLYRRDVDEAYAELMAGSMEAHDKRHARRTTLHRKREERFRRPHQDPITNDDSHSTRMDTASCNQPQENNATTTHGRPVTRGTRSPHPPQDREQSRLKSSVACDDKEPQSTIPQETFYVEY